VEAAREKPGGLSKVADRVGEGRDARDHKRIYRVYREAGLTVRRRKGNACCERAGAIAVTAANQEWAVDFVPNAAESGRKFEC